MRQELPERGGHNRPETLSWTSVTRDLLHLRGTLQELLVKREGGAITDDTITDDVEQQRSLSETQYSYIRPGRKDILLPSNISKDTSEKIVFWFGSGMRADQVESERTILELERQEVTRTSVGLDLPIMKSTRSRFRILLGFATGIALAGGALIAESPIVTSGTGRVIYVPNTMTPGQSSARVRNSQYLQFKDLELGDTFYEYLCQRAGQKVDRVTPQSMSAIMNVAADHFEAKGQSFNDYINFDGLDYFRITRPDLFARIVEKIKSEGIVAPSVSEISNFDFSQLGQQTEFEDFYHHLAMYFVDLDKVYDFYAILYKAQQYLNGTAVDDGFEINNEVETDAITIDTRSGANIDFKTLQDQQEFHVDAYYDNAEYDEFTLSEADVDEEGDYEEVALTEADIYEEGDYEEVALTEADIYEEGDYEEVALSEADVDDEDAFLLTDVVKEQDDGNFNAVDFFGMNDDEAEKITRPENVGQADDILVLRSEDVVNKTNEGKQKVVTPFALAETLKIERKKTSLWGRLKGIFNA